MEILDSFKKKSKQLKERNLFRKGATENEINDFEKYLNIKLPIILKNFYKLNNGGCFADDSWDSTDLTNKSELGTIYWNSNYFLSLEEIIDSYNFKGKYESINFKEQEKETNMRLIPILHTEGQECIVWNATKENETPILDAFHEYNADEWDILFNSIEELLENYIENEGNIETIA